EMLQNILEKLNKIYSFERLSLNRYKKETEELYVTNVFPEDSLYPYIGTFIPIERSIYWEVIEHNIYKNHYVTSENKYLEDTSFLHIGLRQVLIFPLRSKGNIIGTLSLGANQFLSLDKSEIDFFQQLSDQLAVSIENVYLFRKVLQSKEEWEQTFSAVVDVIILVDIDGKIIRLNETGKELLSKYHYVDNINSLLYGITLPKDSIIQRCSSTKQATYEEVKLENENYE